MASIADLARHEPEHSARDFKRIQYSPEKHEDLLTDLMALANAHVAGNRHIIVGVIPMPGGPNDLRGIDASVVTDDAVHQKLARDNIEPEIGFSYSAERVGDVMLGVFRLFRCDDRPYTMRKDYGKLRRGMGYIRKGTHQALLAREDLDRIYAARVEATRPHDVFAVFDAPDDPVVLDVAPASSDPLPSQRAAAKIRAILDDRARRTAERAAQRESGKEAAFIDQFIDDTINNPRALLRPPGYTISYEETSTDELRQELARVSSTHAEEDSYEFGETRAAKINFKVVNKGPVCVYGAALELTIHPPPAVFVAAEPVPEPTRYAAGIRIPSLGLRSYPHCERQGSSFMFRAVIGDVRPGEVARAFGDAIRITAGVRAAGTETSLAYRILGQNVDRPIEGRLSFRVIEPASVPVR